MNRYLCVRIGFTLLLAVTMQASAAGGFKCWTNHEGVRECGQTVPPEFTRLGHDVINKMGIKIGEGKRAPTQEELEERARQEQRSREEAVQQAERERQAEEQRRRDRVLLSTFTSEQEIVHSRDEKIAAIESNIKLTRNRVAKLKDNLAKLRQRAAQMERSSKEVPEKQQKAISQVEQNVRKNDAYIEERHKEVAQINQDYERMLQRFRELKPGSSPLSKEEAEQERQAEEQRRRDRVLLSTFTSEQKIVYSRDEELAAIESSIKLTRNRVAKLKDNLARLRQRAAQMERSSEGVSEEQQEAISQVEQNLAKNDAYIEERYKEMVQINQDYGRMLQRFRELKSGSSP